MDYGMLFGNLWFTLGVLIATALYSVALGGMARTRVVRERPAEFGVAALGILIYAVYSCAQMWHSPYGWIVTILGSFWSGVFFLGAMVVVNQDLTHANGAVHIRGGSLLYKVLVKCGNLDPDKPRTLCNLSWLGMIAIIGWPMCVCIAFVISLFAVVGLAFLTGRNLGVCYKAWHDSESVLCARWRGIPASPALVAMAIGLGYLFIWLMRFPLVVTFYHIIAMLAVVGLVTWGLAYAVTKLHGDLEPAIPAGPSPWVRFYRGALVPTGRAVKTGTVTPWVVAYKVFITLKKTVCPLIIIDED